jgi:hypothetical protein
MAEPCWAARATLASCETAHGSDSHAAGRADRSLATVPRIMPCRGHAPHQLSRASRPRRVAARRCAGRPASCRARQAGHAWPLGGHRAACRGRARTGWPRATARWQATPRPRACAAEAACPRPHRGRASAAATLLATPDRCALASRARPQRRCCRGGRGEGGAGEGEEGGAYRAGRGRAASREREGRARDRGERRR